MTATVRINGVLHVAPRTCLFCDWTGEWPALHMVEAHWPCECGHRRDEHSGTCLAGLEDEAIPCDCEDYIEAETCGEID